MTSSAPSSIPDLMYACTRLYCLVLASGPMVTSLSLGSPTLMFSTATLRSDDELGAFLDPRLDVRLHALVLLGAREWADGDVLVPRIAHLDVLDGHSQI